MTARRPGGRTARTRAAVLRAGLEALATEPPRLSFEDLAALAGVNKTTVYRNWTDSGAVIADALDAESDHEVAGAETGPLAERLHVLGQDARRWFAGERDRRAVASVVAVAQHDERVAAAFDRYWRRRLALVGEGDAQALAAAELLAAQTMFHAIVQRRPIEDDDVRRFVAAAVAGAAALPG